MSNEQWILHNNSSVFGQVEKKNGLFERYFHLKFRKTELAEILHLPCTLRVNSLPLTYAGVQRWNWNLQLSMDSIDIIVT